MNLGVTAVMLPELDFDEQIQLCASLGVKYYQYRPRVIPANRRNEPWQSHGNHKFDLTPERFLREGAELTKKLRAGGMEPWGALPGLGIDAPEAELRLHIEAAAKAEAKCVRCQPPGYPSGLFDYEELLKRTIDLYGKVVEKISGPAGIKLIIETHAGCIATSPGLARAICTNFDPKRVGVIFDMANFPQEGLVRANLAVSVLRPYIDCCHVGGARSVDGHDADGVRTVSYAFCAMDESNLHVPTWIGLLTQAAPNAPLIIEDFRGGASGPEKLSAAAVFLRRVLDR